MRFRVESGRGRLAIQSAPGQGATIDAWLPAADTTAGTA
jgi:signal transduction histidine kinase